MSNNYLAQEVEVAGSKYVVQAVGADAQRKILQKLGRYGIAHLIAGLAKAEAAKDPNEVKKAYVQTIVAIITNMPEEDQDYCIDKALEKTAIKGDSDPVSVDMFVGKIAEFYLLGAKAIGVQLGDFSFFQSLIKDLMAGAAEENE